jgi:hypothetical protein
MREEFVPRRFNRKARATIDLANTIIADYQAQGYSLTIRQLYYQLVARQHIPNNQKEYDKLARTISVARLAGEIDWDAIEDRTRNLQRLPTWNDPSEALAEVAGYYREDLWAAQTYAPEIWIEKDALTGVIEGICDRYRVPFFSCRGYTSQSEQYVAGKRFEEVIEQGRQPIVLHLGDHDPSGIDMTRDNRERLAMFARQDVKVLRLALNRDQVDRYGLPENPTKESDARHADYIAAHGPSCWELDALQPQVITQLISDAIEGLIDQDEWNLAIARENETRVQLSALANTFELP